MKKIIAFGIAIYVIFAIAMCCGEYEPKVKEKPNKLYISVDSFRYDGHQFLRFSRGTVSNDVHDPDCIKCKQKR